MTDIFDEMVATKAEPEATGNTAETTETNASEWPKTLTLPVGERPEGSATVSEFAEIVNKDIVGTRVAELIAEGKSPVEAAMEGMNAQVSLASFYQSVKSQRNPLPHYIVRYEVPVLDDNDVETGEVKVEEKTFVPVNVAREFWKNRPTRGMGGAATSEETLEKRLIRAGKKSANLAAAKKRLAKLTETVKTMESQLENYVKLLEADGKTLDEAIEAYENSVEDAEGEAAENENE